MKHRHIKMLFSVIAITVLILPFVVDAETVQSGLDDAVGNTEIYQAKANPEGAIYSFVGTIIKTIIGLTGIIMIIYMIYGGYLWMTAKGETDRVEKAKHTMQAAIIGIIIVFASYSITAYILSKLNL